MTNRKKHVFIALLLALLARLATYPFAEIENPAFFEYGYLASNLLAGNGYSTIHWIGDSTITVPSAWMPPGQVMITFAFFSLFGKGALAYHLLFLFNALLGTLAVYVLARCTRLVTGNSRTEIVALYTAALFPPFISASSTWGVATSILLLNSVLIYCAVRFSQALSNRSDVTKRAVRFGLIGGLLTLFRAEAPLTLALIVLGILIFHRRELGRILKPVILSGVLMAAMLAPWVVINYVRFDDVILGSTSGGYNLWRGNSPVATGGGWNADGKTVLPSYEDQKEILQEMGGIDSIRFERDYSKQLAHRATAWIKANPGKAFLLSLKKVLLIWTVDLYYSNDVKYVYGIFQLCAVGLAIMGLVTLRRSRISTDMKRWLWIAGGASLATTLLTMVFFSLPRYQIFLVGLYFPLVAIGMHALLSKWGLLKDGITPALGESELAA